MSRQRRLRAEIMVSAIGAVLAGALAVIALFVGPWWAVVIYAVEGACFLGLAVCFARLLQDADRGRRKER